MPCFCCKGKTIYSRGESEEQSGKGTFTVRKRRSRCSGICGSSSYSGSALNVCLTVFSPTDRLVPSYWATYKHK